MEPPRTSTQLLKQLIEEEELPSRKKRSYPAARRGATQRQGAADGHDNPPPEARCQTPRLQKRNADPFPPWWTLTPALMDHAPPKIFFFLGDQYHHRQFSRPWWTLMTWVTPCKESDVKSEIRGMQCNTGLESQLIDRLKISIIMENILDSIIIWKLEKYWNYEWMIEL